MVRLVPVTSCAGLLPVAVGSVTLTEVIIDRLTSVSPFAGQDGAVSAALKDQIGVALPGPNRTAVKGDAYVQWFGHRTWLVRGDITLAGLAATTDQSDAWAIVNVRGTDCESVLARLIPIDLRAAIFKKGLTARTMLGHMNVAVTRTGPQAFEIMAMRSMAGTLVHELDTAMTGVASR